MAIPMVSESETDTFEVETAIMNRNSDSDDELDELESLQNHDMPALSPAKKLLHSSSSYLLQSMPWSEEPCKAKRSPSLKIPAIADENVPTKDSPKLRSQEPAPLCKSVPPRPGAGPGNSGSIIGKAGDTGPTRPNLILTSDHHRPTGIADALSSAFINNAEEPYPQSAIKALRARRNEFRDTSKLSALGTRSSQKVQRNQELEDYLDVDIAPISFRTSATGASQEAEAKEAAELEGIIAAFNRRHILRSLSSKSTFSKSATSYACSSESYTAAYLNRVSEWFSPEGADQAANIENRPIAIHPTPQIPHVLRPANPADSNDLTNDDETSTRSVTPASTIVQIPITESPTGKRRGAGEIDVRYTKRRRMMTSLSNTDESESVPSHTMFLERLLKGKTKPSEEKVERVKSYLTVLGRAEQTTTSAEFEACRQEDKNAFLRALYRLLTSSDLGVFADDLNKSAAAVLEKYGLGD